MLRQPKSEYIHSRSSTLQKVMTHTNMYTSTEKLRIVLDSHHNTHGRSPGDAQFVSLDTTIELEANSSFCESRVFSSLRIKSFNDEKRKLTLRYWEVTQKWHKTTQTLICFNSLSLSSSPSLEEFLGKKERS